MIHKTLKLTGVRVLRFRKGAAHERVPGPGLVRFPAEAGEVRRAAGRLYNSAIW